MVRPQQGQLNILGRPGAGTDTLLANQAGRTAESNRVSSGMLQTAMSNVSQQAIAREGQAASTDRANIAADTSRANARTTQQTAREGIASQEAMQGRQIEADDRVNAARIKANQWQTRFQAETTKQIAADNLALDQARQDFEESVRAENVEFAKEDRRIQQEQFNKTHEATVQYNKTQLEMKMLSFGALLKMMTKDMGEQEAAAAEEAAVENLVTEYQSQKQQADANQQFTQENMQTYIDTVPESIFELTNKVPLTGFLAEGMKGQGITVNENIFTDPNKLAEAVAQGGAEWYMALEHTTKAAETIIAQELGDAKSVKKPSFLKAVTSGEAAGRYVGSKRRTKVLEERRDELQKFRHMLNKLDRSEMPLGTDGRTTVGQMVPTWRSILNGQTVGHVLALKKARGNAAPNTSMESSIMEIMEVLGADLSPEMQAKLEQLMGSSLVDKANQKPRSEIMNLGINDF